MNYIKEDYKNKLWIYNNVKISYNMKNAEIAEVVDKINFNIKKDGNSLIIKLPSMQKRLLRNLEQLKRERKVIQYTLKYLKKEVRELHNKLSNI